MSGVPDATAMAGRFSLSTLRVGKAWPVRGLLECARVWLPDFGDSGDDLPGHANAFARVVSRHVVGDHPEERRQRIGAATSAGPEELRDGLDDGCINCVAPW